MVCISASDQAIPPLMIHQRKQPSFQDLYKLSVHNCSKVLGVLAFCKGRMPNTHEHKSFLFASIISQSAGSGSSVVCFLHVLCCLNAP